MALRKFSLLLGAVCAPLFSNAALAQNCPALKQLGNIHMKRAGAGGMGVFLIPVIINDKPKQMALSANSVTAIFPDQLQELGLQPREIRFAPNIVKQNLRFSNLVTAAGQRSEQYVHVDTLVLDRAGKFTSNDFMVAPAPPNGRTRPNLEIAGQIGLEVLSHFDLEFDLSHSTLNLFDVNHCDGQVVYWTQNPAAVVPMDFDTKGRIRVKVKLDGHDLDAVVDPGAVQDVVNLNIAEDEMKFDKTAPGVQRGPDQPSGAEVYRASFKTLSLEGITVQNPTVLLVEDKIKRQMNQTARTGTNIRNSEDNREPDITLGINLLSKLRVYAAFKEKKLYITAAE
jgi:hypothetical protein